MDFIYYDRKITKNGEISFPPLQCWNPTTKVITVLAQVNGKRVSCRISFSDLKKKYHVFKDNPMNIVSKYRPEIESAARKLIEGKYFERDGSIKIAYKDL